MKLGCTFFGLCYPGPAELIAVAQDLEQRGIDNLFVTEYGMDVMTLLAALAQATRRATIGSAIANVFFRHPYELGMATANVAALSQGRLALGLGVGHPDENVEWLGLPMDRPLSRLRDYLAVLRGTIESSNGAIDVATSEYRVTGGRIVWPPKARVPIWLAALGDRAVRLAAEQADGVILSLAPLEQIRRIRSQLDAAARAAGRDPKAITMAAVIFCCLRPDRAEAREVLRRATTGYLKRPYYQNAFAANGIGSRDGMFDDAAIDRIMIAGPAEYARDRLAAYADAGLDLALLSPPLRGEPDLQAAYRAIAALNGG